MGALGQFALDSLDPNQQQALVQQLQQSAPGQTAIPSGSGSIAPDTAFSFGNAGNLNANVADLSSTQQPATTGGTEDLENRRAANVDMTSHFLQATQQQNLALQDQLGQAQQQVNDPLNRIAGHLADEYEQQQQARATGVMGMLRNFFGGMGAAMMHDSGLLSPEQKQGNILQQLMQVKNGQTIDTLRTAQAQQLQLVTRTLPDGTPIQLTQAEAGKFDTGMARGQLANQKPDLNDLIGRTVFNALKEGRDPNQDPIVQQLIQVQRGMQKPPADTAAAQKESFMQGIQPAILAKEITPAMITDVKQLVTGIQSSRAIPAQQKPALVSYLLANTTPASQGTQTTFKIQQEDQNKQVPFVDTKTGNSLVYLTPAELNARNGLEPGRYIQPGQSAAQGKTGYAYDPSSNQTVLTSSGEAQQKGYQAFRSVSEADIRKDTSDTRVLNDVAVKSNNLIAASKVMDDDSQRRMISRVIDAAEHDDQYKAGLFGMQIPTAWFNNLINSETKGALSQQGRDYLIAILSLRETSMGMQRILTGTARANESHIKALQATIPGVEPDSAMVKQKMAAFTQNLDMLRQGIPKLPGIDVVPIDRSGMQYQQPQQFNFNPSAGTVAPARSPLQLY